MQAVEFFVPGKPEPKGSMSAYVIRGTNRAVVTDGNKALKPWAAKIRLLASNQIVEIVEDLPVVVRFEFLLDRPASVKVAKRPDHVIRPDLDKLIRGAMDALTGVLFHDDSQVVKIEAHKRYALAGETAGVRISVTPFVYPENTQERFEYGENSATARPTRNGTAERPRTGQPVSPAARSPGGRSEG